MRDIGRTTVTELFKMTLPAIFSILNNVSIKRYIFLNFRKFTRENKPNSSGKSELQMFFLPISGRHVCAPQKDTNMASPYKAL